MRVSGVQQARDDGLNTKTVANQNARGADQVIREWAAARPVRTVRQNLCETIGIGDQRKRLRSIPALDGKVEQIGPCLLQLILSHGCVTIVEALDRRPDRVDLGQVRAHESLQTSEGAV